MFLCQIGSADWCSIFKVGLTRSYQAISYLNEENGSPSILVLWCLDGFAVGGGNRTSCLQPKRKVPFQLSRLARQCWVGRVCHQPARNPMCLVAGIRLQTQSYSSRHWKMPPPKSLSSDQDQSASQTGAFANRLPALVPPVEKEARISRLCTGAKRGLLRVFLESDRFSIGPQIGDGHL